jgi:hypothetical protein
VFLLSFLDRETLSDCALLKMRPRTIGHYTYASLSTNVKTFDRRSLTSNSFASAVDVSVSVQVWFVIDSLKTLGKAARLAELPASILDRS